MEYAKSLYKTRGVKPGRGRQGRKEEKDKEVKRKRNELIMKKRNLDFDEEEEKDSKENIKCDSKRPFLIIWAGFRLCG